MRRSKPVRLQTAPTGGENVYLFLEFAIDGTNDTEKTGKRDGKNFASLCLSDLAFHSRRFVEKSVSTCNQRLSGISGQLCSGR